MFKTVWIVGLGSTRISCPCHDYKSARSWQICFADSGEVDRPYTIVQDRIPVSIKAAEINLKGEIVAWHGDKFHWEV